MCGAAARCGLRPRCSPDTARERHRIGTVQQQLHLGDSAHVENSFQHLRNPLGGDTQLLMEVGRSKRIILPDLGV